MSAHPDGRASRWTEHRRVRREELVGAAVEAVRRVGAELAVDDVARSAGVSKTVIYRYVADIDEEPQLNRFGYAQAGRSASADLVADAERVLAQALEEHLAPRMREVGRPTQPASTWAYGVVGMVQLAAHRWADTRHVPSAELVDHLTELAYGGLGVLLPPHRTGTPA